MFDVIDLFNLTDAMFDQAIGTSDMYYPVPSFPKVDVTVEKDNSMKFEFYLAGYKKEDVCISFKENCLVLATVKDFKAPEKTGKVLVKTGKVVPFSYSYTVPESKFNYDATEAVFENGVLTIKIPRSAEKAAKEIKIN